MCLPQVPPSIWYESVSPWPETSTRLARLVGPGVPGILLSPPPVLLSMEPQAHTTMPSFLGVSEGGAQALKLASRALHCLGHLPGCTLSCLST